MAYSAKSQKTYNDKCNFLRIKFTEKETSEYSRLIKYLADNNVLQSHYIKQLIKEDLDSKKIPYPE